MKRKLIVLAMIMLVLINIVLHYMGAKNELNYITSVMAAFNAGLYFMDGILVGGNDEKSTEN